MTGARVQRRRSRPPELRRAMRVRAGKSYAVQAAPVFPTGFPDPVFHLRLFPHSNAELGRGRVLPAFISPEKMAPQACKKLLWGDLECLTYTKHCEERAWAPGLHHLPMTNAEVVGDHVLLASPRAVLYDRMRCPKARKNRAYLTGRSRRAPTTLTCGRTSKSTTNKTTCRGTLDTERLLAYNCPESSRSGSGSG